MPNIKILFIHTSNHCNAFFHVTTNKKHRDDRLRLQHNQIITINHPNKPSVFRGNRRHDRLRIVTHLLGSISIRFTHKLLYQFPQERRASGIVKKSCLSPHPLCEKRKRTWGHDTAVQTKNIIFSRSACNLNKFGSRDAAENSDDDVDDEEEDVAEAGDCPSTTASQYCRPLQAARSAQYTGGTSAIGLVHRTKVKHMWYMSFCNSSEVNPCSSQRTQQCVGLLVPRLPQ